jgi:hypothetical protein
VADTVLFQAMDHRPLVEAEAAEVGGTVEGGGEQPADGGHPWAAVGDQGLDVDGHRVADCPVVTPARPVARTGEVDT